jgi:hypothetical protein
MFCGASSMLSSFHPARSLRLAIAFTTETNRTYDKEKDQINNQVYY